MSPKDFLQAFMSHKEPKLSAIRLENVCKQWGATHAVQNVSFEINEGSLLVLLGPSGCGKSTTLRLIAGLESVSSGRIYIADRDVTDLPPAERRLAMVFQSYALFPHLTVRDNILFGLKVRKVTEADQKRRLENAVGPWRSACQKALCPFWRAAAARGPWPRTGGRGRSVPDGRTAL